MVSDSEMVAMESQSLFRMVPFLTPMTSPSTEWWFQIIKCTQGLISRRVLPLGDYITEDIDKTSFAYNRCDYVPSDVAFCQITLALLNCPMHSTTDSYEPGLPLTVFSPESSHCNTNFDRILSPLGQILGVLVRK